MLQCVFEMF